MNTKIAYLSVSDPNDIGTWSGIHYHITRSLQEFCGDVDFLGPAPTPFSYYTAGAFSKFSRNIFKKRFDYYHTVPLAKAYAKFFEKKLAGKKYDLIFTLPFTTPIAFLKTDIPIVYYSDSVFSGMLNYYPVYSNLWKFSERQSLEIERMGIQKSKLALFSSRWAADSAIKNLGADKNNVFVVPMGANMDERPVGEKLPEKKKNQVCQLLFVGKEWDRKGGPIAFDTLLKLNELGIPAELTVCGCTPPEEFKHKNFHFIPYLDKNKAEDKKRLNDLYRDADFFFLPTRAEAFGIVFCEASSFGLPSLSTDTGGVADAVIQGENGILLPFSAGGDEYAKAIIEIFADEKRYSALRASSRKVYEEKLNWNAWGKSVKKIIDSKILLSQE